MSHLLAYCATPTGWSSFLAVGVGAVGRSRSLAVVGSPGPDPSPSSSSCLSFDNDDPMRYEFHEFQLYAYVALWS